MNKAETLAQYATKLHLDAVVDDVTVVRTHNAEIGETVVVTWTRKGDHLTFHSAHVSRPGKPNRKLRNASDAAQWMENWAAASKGKRKIKAAKNTQAA